jgi:hypothetical protein
MSSDLAVTGRGEVAEKKPSHGARTVVRADGGGIPGMAL